MKPMFMRRIFVCMVSSMTLAAWADFKSSIPSSIQLHASPQGQWSGSTAAVPPNAFFTGFAQSDEGRYLTITLGPEFINLISGRSASFTGQLAPDRCMIVDAPVSLAQRDWTARAALYGQQTKQLHECVSVRIKDIAGLQPAPEQKFCDVLRVSPTEGLVSGGVCYFKISAASNFSLTYELNPQCADETRFADLGLTPLDIFAFTGFYVSGDASGQSTQLKPLGSTGLRLTIEPHDEQVRLSTPMGQGYPRWPVVAFPDAHMGAFDIFKRDGGTSAVLTTQVFAQNQCQSEGKEDCHFGFPLGMQFNLKEIRSDGRVSLLDQWYSGGVVPAFWQGFLPAARELTFADFRVGHRYRIEADLTYLSLYYRLFNEEFKNFLISLSFPSIDPTQPLLPLRPIATLPKLKSYNPNTPLPNLQPLVAGGASDLSVELNRMRSLISDINWPPYYERMCGELGCVRALEGQARLKVGVDFTIDSFEQGHAKTSNYRVWRQSAYLSDYDLQPQSLMRPDCQ